MKKTLLFFLNFLITAPVLAEIPIYYWDNQEEFVKAEGCSISHIEQHRFRISNYFGSGDSKTENLRNYSGVRQSHLVNGSLVKIIEGKNKRKYKKIEVVGVNKDPQVRFSRWFSERLDQGYLYDRSLLPLEDYALKLDEKAPNVKLGNVRDNLVDTYWKLAAESKFFKLNCPNFAKDREYLIFRVYDKTDQDRPLAIVGVYWDETKIFRSFRTFTKAEAHRTVHTILEEEPLEDLILEGDMTGETDQPVNDIIDEVEPPIIVTLPDAGDDTGQDDDVIQGGMDNVVCIETKALNVRDETLDKVLFSTALGEQVKIFQGWGENKKQKTIQGITYDFIKVEFKGREEQDQKVGWVAEKFIEPKSECKFLNGNIIIRAEDQKITGLDDPACCEFPTVKKATHSFSSGMRRFGAGRSGGRRLHAACDLYRYESEPILSVAPGTVIRDRYYFYQGTYAIEVVHSGGFVVRYGELNGKNASGIKAGAKVKMSQRIGYMGKVNSNCCRPMLHFELYSGSKKGPLSQSGNRYNRRKDLIDPTNHLIRWENKRF